MSGHPSPEERLALSRARLRLALRAPQPQASAGSPSETATGVALEALRLWWKKQPLREVGTQAVQTVGAILAPIAQRNPLGLVLAAFAAGGLLTLAKPWRWISLPAIFAGVLPQVAEKLVKEFPPSTWPETLDAFLRRSGAHNNKASK